MTNQAVLRVAAAKVPGAAVRASRGASNSRRVSHRHPKVPTWTIFSANGATAFLVAAVRAAQAQDAADAVVCNGR